MSPLADAPSLSASAPAKVNLFLHVGPVQTDGYHPLVSLVTFADVGDRITARAADRFSLDVTGPFAEEIQGGPNLIETALRALAAALGTDQIPLAVTLDKRLPVAAGLGGGSSDAATALTLARRIMAPEMSDKALAALAAPLGADMVMCLKPEPAVAEGRGERLSPAPGLPTLHAVLANPRTPSPTGAVYRAYDAAPRTADRPETPAAFASAPELARWLSGQRNDLEAPAIALSPSIGTCLRAVAASPDVLLARVTGSGATVFGLYETEAQAAVAARTLNADHPGWWVAACRLGPPRDRD